MKKNIVIQFNKKLFMNGKNKKILYEYILNLLYRKIYGIPDIADRNFLIVDGNVTSVDEENFGHNTIYQNALRYNYAHVLNFINENYEKINKVLNEWNKKIHLTKNIVGENIYNYAVKILKHNICVTHK